MLTRSNDRVAEGADAAMKKIGRRML
jgi:hypothetical protein